MITDAQIEELLKLAEEAHMVGHWAYYQRPKNAVKAQYLNALNDEGESMWTWPGFVQVSFKEDALYIVAAANLAPKLAKELQEARAEIERLKNE